MTQRFAKISEIDPRQPQSWTEKYFLTIDIDWASDFVLDKCIDLLEQTQIKATWFVTHETKLLDKIRRNPNFELGAHPNFNNLLEPESAECAGQISAAQILDSLLTITGPCKSVRSHSLTMSSKLSELFLARDIKFECNSFIPVESEIELRPWLLWNGLCAVPHFWEDDLHCAYKWQYSAKQLLATPGLKVFDFHPIHLFLNTESLERYNQARGDLSDPGELQKHVNSGRGVRNLLEELISLASC